MKTNFIKYGLFGLSLFAMTSCIDTMDTHPSTSFEESVVWGSKSSAEAFINAIYNDVITGCGYAGSGSSVAWEARTPNGVKCSQVGEGIDGVATELGVSKGSDFGANRYALLRRCNLSIAKVTASSLSQTEKDELLASAHFLRGLIFFDQARKMGRFVPLTEVLEVGDAEKANVLMTKDLDESYQYVLSDLKKAANDLPATNGAGLPTKWAAGVILSRAALQAYAYTGKEEYRQLAEDAASTVIKESGVQLTTSNGMFNETDDKNPEILWAYYRNKENTTIQSFDELMRTYPNISTDNVTNSQCPIPLVQKDGAATFEGWAIYFPTQDLVDQFLVTDEATGKALPWYETSQYKNNVQELDPATVTKEGQLDSYYQLSGDVRRIPTPQDFKETKENYPTFTRYAQLKDGVTATNLSKLMYEKRDNRFYATVVYDGCSWIGETVETNLGGNLSQGVRDKEDGGWYNTTTGYYWRKGNIENPTPRAYYSCNVALHFNLARLGEAYMNLAEALLLKGDANSVAEAVKALNQTRTVHGGLAPSEATTLKDAWADYIRERNCEMTNEGADIYFSYLRWGKYCMMNSGANAAIIGIADTQGIIKDLDRPTYKIEISRDRTKLLIGQLTLQGSAKRYFTKKRYLFPIVQSFLDTREAYGLDHDQNDGW